MQIGAEINNQVHPLTLLVLSYAELLTLVR